MNCSILPQDIIHHILSYNDSIKYRNKKYMNQFHKGDYRYKLLLKIPPIVTENINKLLMVRYGPTNTLWLATQKADSIYYTFWYDVAEIPGDCCLWIRY